MLLFNEMLRFNLDPDALVSDEEIVLALTRTGLWSHFRVSHADSEVINSDETPISITISKVDEQRGILDRQLSLFSEMSMGQSQLFALSRALIKASILRRSGARPVVLLDEATSALDAAFESTIYRIIDEEFTMKGHTVIIVAHRVGVLGEFMKSGRDAVVSMAGGRLDTLTLV